MALATRCPQCGAMFRVVADQLKLRGGLVRCGQCRTVFDAIGSLAYVEDGTVSGSRPGESTGSESTDAATGGAAATSPAPTPSPTPQPSPAPPPSPAATASPPAPFPASAAASAPAPTDVASTRPAAAATPAAATPSAASTPAAPSRDAASTSAEAARTDRPAADAATSATSVRGHSRTHAERPRRTETRAPSERRSRDAQEQQRKALGPATTLRIAPGASPVATVSQTLPAYAERRAAPDAEQDQLGVPTLLAPGAGDEDSDPMLDGIEVIEMPPLPDVMPAPPTPDEEPAFIRSREPRARRGFSIVFSGGSLLLLLLALLQTAVVFRAELTTRWPQVRPMMVKVCDAVGCTLGLPTRPEQLAVIASELQAVAGTDVLELTAVIRNRASFTQALPALEVTLSDTQSRALARKVFAPVDYLAAAGEPSSRIAEGLAAGGDLTIRVLFEARGLRPAGFLVYPFYI